MLTRNAGTINVYDTPADVARAVAELFVSCANDAIRERGSFAVSLAGGTTPKAAYALLAREPLRDAFDWSKVQIFFGDERCVPPDDERSNYKMARLAFLDAVGIPPANVHRIKGEDDPVDAAGAYRAELTYVLGDRPRFDLVLLGMGPDGHTASLFPGSDPLEGDDALARAVYSNSQQQWRVTLTPRVFNDARTVAFAVEGSAKAQMLHRVRHDIYEPSQLPSQIIAPHDGKLLWLVDKAAASP
jgi:6-phosphogluconolactonase